MKIKSYEKGLILPNITKYYKVQQLSSSLSIYDEAIALEKKREPTNIEKYTLTFTVQKRYISY